MIRYREQDDGSRLFPVRGQPPPETAGYVRDPGNAFILRPILPECELRVEQVIETECCGRQHAYWACQSVGTVGFKTCTECVSKGLQEERITQVRIQRGNQIATTS